MGKRKSEAQDPPEMPSAKKKKDVVSEASVKEPKPPFPRVQALRKDAINPDTGTKCTPFQFHVWDLTTQVPAGKFTTYNAISKALKSAPRAVGQALRANPYAPEVPCHRVLASDFFVGGFSGQWGLSCARPNVKKSMLENEGLTFDDAGYVIKEERQSCFFDDFKLP